MKTVFDVWNKKKSIAFGSLQGNNRKPKYVYKTAQDVIESGLTRKKRPIQSSELSKVKVIDMTGKEKRVLSGFFFSFSFPFLFFYVVFNFNIFETENQNKIRLLEIKL